MRLLSYLRMNYLMPNYSLPLSSLIKSSNLTSDSLFEDSRIEIHYQTLNLFSPDLMCLILFLIYLHLIFSLIFHEILLEVLNQNYIYQQIINSFHYLNMNFNHHHLLSLIPHIFHPYFYHSIPIQLKIKRKYFLV